ncbi:ABC1 kinase family protein [Roseivivax sediminis]|uniref:Predicted unusual protein kinase regulating ubiquinone biosynthesis, AarF/ABC1/UbiB family n=1 Tax=Roseivivax sediminis TaxID=936889 RepID=A0A1I1W2U7_9RHOB|nr:AarF/ABC1/UbiB kinase family protein [Roseivivax sediminis]SFD89349.1 Predicted unusual protein kinase regulating ubiquinone biosynthesis, AarF/ABC1/UbiB family [Roseivivax sediminis]
MDERDRYLSAPLPVPSRRLGRLMRLGGLTGGLVGRAAWAGAGELARGRRPEAGRLLLTPANAARVTAELARMRGAAMKLGQLISMEAGEYLSPELAQILAALRAEAHAMPPPQLKRVLSDAWGDDFLHRFRRFDVRPVAAASIGQVHRAEAKDGRELAVKVQYPGIRASIDSDIANLGAVIRWSGLVPKGLDLAPLLEEARAQLHEEADYAQEARSMARFADLLEGEPGFAVPRPHDDLTTRDILTMDFLQGAQVENLAGAAQEVRDDVARRLIALIPRELFEFGLVQTDPNFANYRYEAETGRIALLDFGATRAIPAALAADFRALLQAGLAEDRAGMRAAAMRIGYLSETLEPGRMETLLDMMDMAFAPLRSEAPFDFAASDLPDRLTRAAIAMGRERDIAPLPPADALFLQRKVAGLYLLAARIGARVALRPLVAPWANSVR